MKKIEFWIANISQQDIMLADLRVTVRAGITMNLLARGSRLTLEQLTASATSGSIFKKLGKLRLVEGKMKFDPLPVVRLEVPRASRRTNAIDAEEKEFPELALKDTLIPND